MNILFFAFANSTLPGQALPSLIEEEESIKGSLRAGEMAGEYNTDFLSYGSLPLIASRLRDFREDLVWFHYSGHAEKNGLLLKDKEVRGEGIVHLLKQCPKLKGVVLNGCSTQWQAAQLRAAGISVVVGTSSPVEDNKATQFSKGFYNLISKKMTVGDSFEMAMGEVLAMEDVSVHRGGHPPGEEEDAPLWGLLFEDNNAKKLNLPFGTETIEELKERLTKLAQLDMGKVIEELNEILISTTEAFEYAFNLSHRYLSNNKKERKNQASPEYIERTYAQISGALLELIEELTLEDLK